MKNTKAILIDSKLRTVSLIEVGDFRDIQRKIGCDCFTMAFDLPKHDICYVDDEGLFSNPETFFTYEGAHQPFAGNGIICGGDSEGETCDVKITLGEVVKSVKFHTLSEVRAMCAMEDVR